MTHVNKTKLNNEGNDLAYWLTKTPAERISALEELRLRYMKFFKKEPSGKVIREISIIKLK